MTPKMSPISDGERIRETCFAFCCIKLMTGGAKNRMMVTRMNLRIYLIEINSSQNPPELWLPYEPTFWPAGMNISFKKHTLEPFHYWYLPESWWTSFSQIYLSIQQSSVTNHSNSLEK
ncbi:hypothetical protein HMI56_005094 [Coelomomyces lativittatus]|nr:hypothetical protein HMI56_005094 [Coelomomyces lativittatus]